MVLCACGGAGAVCVGWDAKRNCGLLHVGGEARDVDAVDHERSGPRVDLKAAILCHRHKRRGGVWQQCLCCLINCCCWLWCRGGVSSPSLLRGAIAADKRGDLVLQQGQVVAVDEHACACVDVGGAVLIHRDPPRARLFSRVT